MKLKEALMSNLDVAIRGKLWKWLALPPFLIAALLHAHMACVETEAASSVRLATGWTALQSLLQSVGAGVLIWTLGFGLLSALYLGSNLSPKSGWFWLHVGAADFWSNLKHTLEILAAIGICFAILILTAQFGSPESLDPAVRKIDFLALLLIGLTIGLPAGLAISLLWHLACALIEQIALGAWAEGSDDKYPQ